MVDHGVDVLHECDAANKSKRETVVAVYLAMECIKEIVVTQAASETKH